MKIFSFFLLAAAIAIVSGSSVGAQSWGRSDWPRDGVCFFRDADYRGDYFCVKTGDDLRSLPRGMDNEISSTRFFGRAHVLVFRDKEFEGRSEQFDTDMPNLKEDGWNDRISSLRVRRSGGGSGGNHPPSGRPDDPDRIVRRAYEDILDRKPDQAGLRLYRSRLIDDGWSEEQVREALRSSPEYREKNTMTYSKAQETVRRAYQAVLGRQPDAGSRGYVDKVLREHWTQGDVERELRGSAEYRNKNR